MRLPLVSSLLDLLPGTRPSPARPGRPAPAPPPSEAPDLLGALDAARERLRSAIPPRADDD